MHDHGKYPHLSMAAYYIGVLGMEFRHAQKHMVHIYTNILIPFENTNLVLLMKALGF